MLSFETIKQNYKQIFDDEQIYYNILDNVSMMMFQQQYEDEHSNNQQFLAALQLSLELQSPQMLLPADPEKYLPKQLQPNTDPKKYKDCVCQKCKLLMTQAIKCTCGCILCRRCINTYTENQCPNCQQKVMKYELLNDISETILQLEFKCPHQKCNFTGSYDECLEHITLCQNRLREMEQNPELTRYLLIIYQNQYQQLQLYNANFEKTYIQEIQYELEERGKQIQQLKKQGKKANKQQTDEPNQQQLDQEFESKLQIQIQEKEKTISQLSQQLHQKEIEFAECHEMTESYKQRYQQLQMQVSDVDIVKYQQEIEKLKNELYHQQIGQQNAITDLQSKNQQLTYKINKYQQQFEDLEERPDIPISPSKNELKSNTSRYRISTDTNGSNSSLQIEPKMTIRKMVPVSRQDSFQSVNYGNIQIQQYKQVYQELQDVKLQLNANNSTIKDKILEIQQLEDKIQQMTLQNKDLTTTYEKLQEDFKDQQQKLNKIGQSQMFQIKQAQQQLTERFEKQIQQMNQNNQDLNNELVGQIQIQQKEKNDIDNICLQMQNDNEQLKQQLANEQNKKHIYEELEQREEENEIEQEELNLKQMQSHFEEQISTLKQSCQKQLDEQEQQYQNQIQQIQDDNQRLHHEQQQSYQLQMEEKQQQFQDLSDKFDQQQKLSQETNDAHLIKIDQLSQQNEILNNQSIDFQSQLIQLSEENVLKQSEIKILKLSGQGNAGVQQIIVQFKDQLDEKEKKIKQLKSDFEGKESQYQETIQNIKQQNIQQTQQLEKLIQNNEQYQNELNQLKCKEDQNDVKDEQIQEQECTSNEYNIQISQLQEKINQQEQQIQNLNNQLTNKEECTQIHISQANEVDTKSLSGEQDVYNLQEEKPKLIDQSIQLSDNYEQEQAIQQQNQLIAQLQQQVSSLTETNNNQSILNQIKLNNNDSIQIKRSVIQIPQHEEEQDLCSSQSPRLYPLRENELLPNSQKMSQNINTNELQKQEQTSNKKSNDQQIQNLLIQISQKDIKISQLKTQVAEQQNQIMTFTAAMEQYQNKFAKSPQISRSASNPKNNQVEVSDSNDQTTSDIPPIYGFNRNGVSKEKLTVSSKTQPKLSNITDMMSVQQFKTINKDINQQNSQINKQFSHESISVINNNSNDYLNKSQNQLLENENKYLKQQVELYQQQINYQNSTNGQSTPNQEFYEQQLSQQKQLIKGLQDQLENMQVSARSSTSHSLVDVQFQLASQKQTNIRVLNENSLLQQQIIQLQEKVNQQNKQFDQLQSEFEQNSSYAQNNQLLHNQIQDISDQYKKSILKQEQLQLQLDSYEKANQSIQLENKKQLQDIALLNVNNEKLQSEYNDIKQENLLLKNNKQQNEKEIISIKIEQQNTAQQLNQALLQSNQQVLLIESLQQQLNTQQSEQNTMSKQIIEQNLFIKQQTQQNVQLLGQVSNYKQMINNLEQQSKSLNFTLSDEENLNQNFQKEQINKLLLQIEQLQVQQKYQDQLKENLNDTLNDQQLELQNKEKYIDQLKQQIEAQLLTNNQLQGNIMLNQQVVQTQTSDINKLANEINNQKQFIEQLQQQIQAANRNNQQQIKQVQDDNKMLVLEINIKQQQQKLKQQQYKNQIIQLQQENEIQQELVKKLNIKLIDQNSINQDQLKAKQNIIDQQNDRMNQVIQQQEQQINNKTIEYKQQIQQLEQQQTIELQTYAQTELEYQQQINKQKEEIINLISQNNKLQNIQQQQLDLNIIVKQQKSELEIKQKNIVQLSNYQNQLSLEIQHIVSDIQVIYQNIHENYQTFDLFAKQNMQVDQNNYLINNSQNNVECIHQLNNMYKSIVNKLITQNAVTFESLKSLQQQFINIKEQYQNHLEQLEQLTNENQTNIKQELNVQQEHVVLQKTKLRLVDNKHIFIDQTNQKNSSQKIQALQVKACNLANQVVYEQHLNQILENKVNPNNVILIQQTNSINDQVSILQNHIQQLQNQIHILNQEIANYQLLNNTQTIKFINIFDKDVSFINLLRLSLQQAFHQKNQQDNIFATLQDLVVFVFQQIFQQPDDIIYYQLLVLTIINTYCRDLIIDSDIKLKLQHYQQQINLTNLNSIQVQQINTALEYNLQQLNQDFSENQTCIQINLELFILINKLTNYIYGKK